MATPKLTGPLALKATRNAYRRHAASETETEDSDAGANRLASRSSGLAPKPGIVSLLSSRPRVEPVTRTRPKLPSTRGREPSPTPSKSSALATDEPPPSPRPRFNARRKPSPARSRASYRDPSPARSVAPTQSEPERSRLWQELRQVRMRSRPPTEKSRSPEPPP